MYNQLELTPCPGQLSFLGGGGEGAGCPTALQFSAMFMEYSNIVIVKSLSSGLSWFTVQGCVILLCNQGNNNRPYLPESV